MANAIPIFAERIDSLRCILKKAYTVTEKRTKRVITKFDLVQIGWGKRTSFRLQNIQEQLQDMVIKRTVTNKRRCGSTRMQVIFYAAVVTKCDEYELSKPPVT